MAGIDVGGHGGKRSTNHEIPLIPFIDFLLCLVMFLLVTAVWSHMARINADAAVPGPPRDEPMETPKKERTLHVEMRGERKFTLLWKEGATVVNTIDVPRKKVTVGEGDFSYPDLGKKIAEEWKANPTRHHAPNDPKFDRAVLHADNSTLFEDVIAVIDAIKTPNREFNDKAKGGKTESVAAFSVTFAAR